MHTVESFKDMQAGQAQATTNKVISIVAASTGNKFIATAQPFNGPAVEGVETKFVTGDTFKRAGRLGEVVFRDYLGKALAGGKYLAMPEPMIIGKGLEIVQEAFEVQKKGVSAKKVVVEL